MPELPVDAANDQVIGGRYRLDELIGRGGMAAVYRARDESLGRYVAIKVFRPDVEGADELRRHNGEVELLAGLNHHGLVTLFDAGVDEHEPPRAFLVMELVEGDDLRKRLENGRLAAGFVASIGADLAEAMHHIHLAGVIHRDVKPANILLAPSDIPGANPRAKLTDFGIARLVDGARLTATGAVIGTASYLSPEQALGHELTPASDVYSLGLVLLECLTGTRAFPGTAIESASARIHRSPLIPRSLPTGWPSLLAKMTARDAETRPSSLAVAQHLEEIRVGQAAAVPADKRDTTQNTAVSATHETSTHETGTTDPIYAIDDSGYAATRVLPVALTATTVPFAHAPATVGPPPTAGSPAPKPISPRSTASRRPRRVIGWWIAAILAALVATAIVLSVVNTPAPVTSPSYPSVSGRLGTDLHQLQESVQP